jgi:septum formation protein
VAFRSLALDEIEEYVQSGSPMDKAGAYGIQDDYGALFVERIEGCFYNVVGFPLTKFYQTLLKFQQEISH